MTIDPVIAALLREREGYVRRGLSDREAAVTAELIRLGHSQPDEDDGPETTALEGPPERAVPPAPRPRKRASEHAQ